MNPPEEVKVEEKVQEEDVQKVLARMPTPIEPELHHEESEAEPSVKEQPVEDKKEEAPAAEPADQVVPGPRRGRRLPRVQASPSGKHLSWK